MPLLKNIKGEVLFISLFLFFSSCRSINIYKSSAENHEFQKEIHLYKLPEEIKESSGLIKIKDRFYSFNDSGGKNSLYSFHSDNPADVKELTVFHSFNYDWEAITNDAENIFIADIGNNFGSRDTLSIYKIKESSLGKSVSIPELIQFSYVEKTSAYSNCWKNPFDCEAMIIRNDSIWLFTKNWQDESSWIYKIPDKPGYHSIKSSFSINPEMLVTDACYDKKNDKLWLIGYHHYYPVIYKYFFDSGIPVPEAKFTLKNHRGLQTEAIYVDEDGRVYFTNEKSIKKASLWMLK